MSAETWLGAAGWASGSQTWSGTRPALDPKPTSARRKTAARTAERQRWGDGAQLAETGASIPREQQERGEQEGQAELGHGEVPAARPQRLRLVRLGHDEEVGGERHALPRGEESHHVVGERDEAHGQEEQVQHDAEQRERAPALVDRGVGGAVERGGDGDEADHDEEEGAERVEPEGEAARDGQERGQLEAERGARQQHVEAEAEPGGSADHGTGRGQRPRGATPATQQGAERARAVAAYHQQEED